MIDKIIRICTRYMAVGVILAGIFGIFFPSVMKPLSPYIPIMLGIIMFGMGMSLTPGDFRNVFKQPKNVALGSLLQFVIMPALAAVLIQIFSLPPAIAIGVVLVGCCPGGTASNVISYIAHADVALSVSMTMVNTILAPFVTPFLIWLIAGAWVDISFTAMMISIIKMVLLPLLAGGGALITPAANTSRSPASSPRRRSCAFPWISAAHRYAGTRCRTRSRRNRWP